jgi:Fe2+ or Zn2+ uptake regulation protein
LGSAVFEKITASAHHHVVCKQCGQITTLENEIVNSLFSEVAESSGYKIITNHLVLFGICPGCLASEEQNGNG